MKNVIFGVLASLAIIAGASSVEAKEKQVLVTVFHSPACHACIKVIHDIIPPLAKKYADKVVWQYFDVSDRGNYEQFLALGKKTGRSLAYPAILVGDKVIVGITEAADSLEKTIDEELASSRQVSAWQGGGVDLLEHFKSFGPLAVIGAGLVDGFNPCAFTVIVFFVSFLSLMGYRRREMAFIGAMYILAVFLTYLALGLGFFKALYGLKSFYLVSRMVYLLIGLLSIYLGILALKDYYIYRKTGRTDAMALQLPKAVKNKIHAIVGDYYRKDRNVRNKALLGLSLSALVVGFMISLLEAVCTGQLYLPTIVFVLKEGTLRARALFYLIAYNLMFILPLAVVLLFALAGVTSKQFEALARRHLGLIKLSMAAVFFALGIVLLVGI